MKRRVRLSTCSLRSILSVPATRLRKPCSAISGLATMPERPAFREAITSSAEFPMDETIPNPVTTTRRMGCSFSAGGGQTHLHVLHGINLFAVGHNPPVSDTHFQPAVD